MDNKRTCYQPHWLALSWYLSHLCSSHSFPSYPMPIYHPSLPEREGRHAPPLLHITNLLFDDDCGLTHALRTRGGTVFWVTINPILLSPTTPLSPPPPNPSNSNPPKLAHSLWLSPPLLECTKSMGGSSPPLVLPSSSVVDETICNHHHPMVYGPRNFLLAHPFLPLGCLSVAQA